MRGGNGSVLSYVREQDHAGSPHRPQHSHRRTSTSLLFTLIPPLRHRLRAVFAYYKTSWHRKWRRRRNKNHERKQRWRYLRLVNDTHAVLPSHGALLHILRFPRQLLKNKKRQRQPAVSSNKPQFSYHLSFCCSLVQVLLWDGCDENLINFNKKNCCGGKTNREILETPAAPERLVSGQPNTPQR